MCFVMLIIKSMHLINLQFLDIIICALRSGQKGWGKQGGYPVQSSIM